MATRISKPRAFSQSKRLEPRRPPIQRRSKATVEALLEGAAQVFETRGYAAGTTNRIAEAAGVSIGTLYQYFPSKEALAIALLERHIEDTQRQRHEWVGHILVENHTLRSALEDYVAGMLDVHSERPRLQHMLLEETPLPEHVHHMLLEAQHQAAKALAGLLRTFREVQRPNLIHAAYVILQSVEALTHQFAAHADDPIIDRAALKEELVVMLVSYLVAMG